MTPLPTAALMVVAIALATVVSNAVMKEVQI
jgi:hypothetical protein